MNKTLILSDSGCSSSGLAAVTGAATKMGGATTAREKAPLLGQSHGSRDKRDAPAKDNMGMDFIPVYEEKQGGLAGHRYHQPRDPAEPGVRLAKVENRPSTSRSRRWRDMTRAPGSHQPRMAG